MPDDVNFTQNVEGLDVPRSHKELTCDLNIHNDSESDLCGDALNTSCFGFCQTFDEREKMSVDDEETEDEMSFSPLNVSEDTPNVFNHKVREHICIVSDEETVQFPQRDVWPGFHGDEVLPHANQPWCCLDSELDLPVFCQTEEQVAIRLSRVDTRRSPHFHRLFFDFVATRLW